VEFRQSRFLLTGSLILHVGYTLKVGCLHPVACTRSLKKIGKQDVGVASNSTVVMQNLVKSII
jgi:hypothetical protein